MVIVAAVVAVVVAVEVEVEVEVVVIVIVVIIDQEVVIICQIVKIDMIVKVMIMKIMKIMKKMKVVVMIWDWQVLQFLNEGLEEKEIIIIRTTTVIGVIRVRMPVTVMTRIVQKV